MRPETEKHLHDLVDQWTLHSNLPDDLAEALHLAIGGASTWIRELNKKTDVQICPRTSANNTPRVKTRPDTDELFEEANITR